MPFGVCGNDDCGNLGMLFKRKECAKNHRNFTDGQILLRHIAAETLARTASRNNDDRFHKKAEEQVVCMGNQPAIAPASFCAAFCAAIRASLMDLVRSDGMNSPKT